MVTMIQIPKVNAYLEDNYIVSGYYYNIKNVRSGQFLDVSGGSASNGANVIQWKYHGDDNQKWKIVYLADIYGSTYGGLYKIVSALDETKALTVSGGSGANNTNICISTFTNSASQRFAFVRNENFTGYILTQASNYFSAITVAGASFNQGANVIQFHYNGSLNGDWLIEPANSYIATNGVKYARANYNNYVPTYPRLTVYNNDDCDCANFVSQCMAAAGKRYSGNWRVYPKNGTYPTPIDSTKLNYSWQLSDPSPWISAVQFGAYWQNTVNYEAIKKTDIVNNNSSTQYVYGRGDVVQLATCDLFGNYVGYHTMYITDLTNYNDKRTYKLTYHSINEIDKKVSDICYGVANDRYFVFYNIA